MLTALYQFDDSSDDDIFVRKKPIRQKFIDSDDDSNNVQGHFDNIDTVTDENMQLSFIHDKNEPCQEKIIRKRLILQLSDAESDENENKPDHILYNSSSLETNKHDIQSQTEKSGQLKVLFSNKDLYDAESSDEESTMVESTTKDTTFISNREGAFDYDLQNCDNSVVKNNIGKKVSTEKSAKQERKSKKAANSEIEHIHSETQRMVRESHVSLPYHRPKQHSLEEFLQRKQSLQAGTMSLKMPMEELATMGQKLEERAKEVEKFYQSDSEESDIQEDIASLKPTSFGMDIDNDNACEITTQLPKELVNTMQDKSENHSRDISCITNISESAVFYNLNNTELQCDSSLKLDCEPVQKVLLDSQESSSFSNFKCPNIDSTSVKCSDEKIDMSECIVYDSHAKDSQDLVLHYTNNQTCDFLANCESVIMKKNCTDSSLKLSDTKNEKSIRVDCIDQHVTSNNTSTANFRESEILQSSKLEIQEFNAGENVKANDTEMCFESVNKVDSKIVEGEDNIATESTTEGVDKVIKECGKTLKSVSHVLNFNPPSDSEDEAYSSGNEKKIGNGLQDLTLTEKHGNNGIETKLSLFSDQTNMKPIPCLSGGPNELVDLDDTPNSKGVLELMHRFMKHSVKKTAEKSKIDLSIITAEKGEDGLEEVKKDTVTVLLAGDEALQEDPTLAKPGAKLQRLKQELQQQMAQRREQEWSRRQQEHQLDNEEIADDCGLLDDENEEEEDGDLTETESEEEEEEEDVPLVDKARVRSAFVDDEADVSEDEEESSDEDEDVQSVHQDCSVTKLQADESTPSKLERTRTIDIFQSQEAIDSEMDGHSLFDDSDCGLSVSVIPPYQPGGALTPIADPTAEKQRFVPPILIPNILKEITNNKGSASVPSVALCEQRHEPSQNTLYSHFQSTSSQLQDLCGGTSVGMLDGLLQRMATPSSTQVEKELLGLCSGKFSSQSFMSQDTLQLEDSQDLKLNLSDDSLSQVDLARADTEPLVAPECENNATKPWQKFVIASSDEEDISFGIQRKQKRKKVSNKGLNFSDEENSESDDDDEQRSPRVIEYDSDENEIVIHEQNQTKEARSRAAKEFFENEAELSESEWGSADEDERDLDTLEWEEGDEEKLNEHKLKEQLGRIHMRRVLDEDQREVRQLQELLLEDGELHSDTGGRQRKFRWKNINNEDLGLENRGPSDDEGLDNAEEEDEEQWRRMRFDREKFLLEQKAKGIQIGDVLNEDSELLRLGKAALKRTSISLPNKPAAQNVSKRGSFLARGESALARIAQITRSVSDNALVGGPKNSRNFVFAVLSPEKKDNAIKTDSVKMIKRKSVEVTPPIVKKLRLSDGNSRGRCLLDQLGY